MNLSDSMIVSFSAEYADFHGKFLRQINDWQTILRPRNLWAVYRFFGDCIVPGWLVIIQKYYHNELFVKQEFWLRVSSYPPVADFESFKGRTRVPEVAQCALVSGHFTELSRLIEDLIECLSRDLPIIGGVW